MIYQNTFNKNTKNNDEKSNPPTFNFNVTLAFAQTKSSYYEIFTSKEDAIKEVKKYDRYLLSLHYKLIAENKISDYDYTRDWSFDYQGLTLSATIRYQFERRTFSVTMSNPLLAAGAESLHFIPEETDPVKKQFTIRCTKCL